MSFTYVIQFSLIEGRENKVIHKCMHRQQNQTFLPCSSFVLVEDSLHVHQAIVYVTYEFI
jgi:hypothetical protein